MVDLSEAVKSLSEWKAGKAFIIHGAGQTFCSGGDLQVMKALVAEPQGGEIMCEFMQHTLSALFQSHLIGVALLQGNALGGGAEIATACDFRLAAPDAKIGFVHRHMGLTAGWGGASRLVRIVGRTNALKLMASGSVINANDAKDITLIDDILTSDNHLEETVAWLSKLINSDANVVQAIKRTVVDTLDRSFEESLQNEKKIFLSLFGGEAQHNALKRAAKHK